MNTHTHSSRRRFSRVVSLIFLLVCVCVCVCMWGGRNGVAAAVLSLFGKVGVCVCLCLWVGGIMRVFKCAPFCF
jgi:hypothetical protein